jgi:UPF0716 protein FxsA
MPLILLLILPLAEIAAFIVVGNAIGVGPTLLLVMASFALGWVMLRDVGILTAIRLQRSPTNARAILADGGARVVAGLLLIVPGFITDLIALAVLSPQVRLWAMSALHPRAAAPDGRRPVIEGAFRRLDD